MEAENPLDVIEAAELGEIYEPMTGDCVSIAVALGEVFGSNEYLCAVEILSDKKFVHATCIIDGFLVRNALYGQSPRGQAPRLVSGLPL